MDLSLLSLGLSLVAVTSYILLFTLTAAVVRRVFSESTFVEVVLITSIACVFLLWIQVYLLSAIPIEKPLGLLWVIHIASIVGVYGIIRRMSGDSLGDLRKSVLNAFGALWRLNAIVRVMVAVCFLYIGLHLVFGFWFQNYDWDGIEYHIPMSIQPYQDGRLGHLGSDLPWIDYYPRGIPLLWYHSLQLTHSIALYHSFQWFGGLLLALLVFALTRRIGGGKHVSSVAALVILFMPIFSRLSISTYIDLPAAWAALLPVLFLSPKRGGRLPGNKDLTVAFAGYALSMQIKLPIIPTMFLLLALAYWLLLRGKDGRFLVVRYLKSWQMPVVAIILLACAYPYINNLVVHGNPLYPVDLRITDRLHLQGPLSGNVFEQYAVSNFGTMADLGRFGRYPASWLDLFQHRTPDSFGLNGAAFILAIAFLFCAFAICSVLERKTWSLALTAMVCCIFLIGSLAIPRYSLPMTAIAVSCACAFLSTLPGLQRKILSILIMVFSLFNVWPGLSSLKSYHNWSRGLLGEEFRWMDRTTRLAEMNQFGYVWYMSPEMVRQVRNVSGAGELLAWNVRTYATFLWNRNLSNRIHHVPGSPSELFPSSAANHPAISEEEVRLWKEKIQDLQPDQILLYSESVYAELVMQMDNPGYEVVYSDSSNRESYRMTLFQKVVE